MVGPGSDTSGWRHEQELQRQREICPRQRWLSTGRWCLTWQENWVKDYEMEIFGLLFLEIGRQRVKRTQNKSISFSLMSPSWSPWEDRSDRGDRRYPSGPAFGTGKRKSKSKHVARGLTVAWCVRDHGHQRKTGAAVVRVRKSFKQQWLTLSQAVG